MQKGEAMSAPANTYAMQSHTVTFSDASSHTVSIAVDAENKRAALLTAAEAMQQGLQSLVHTDTWTITIA
jgi:hypothetical protein